MERWPHLKLCCHGNLLICALVAVTAEAKFGLRLESPPLRRRCGRRPTPTFGAP